MNTHTPWLQAVAELEANDSDYVLVTLLGTRGSTPRDTATKMVISREAAFGTIGGGHLELRCTEIALQLLREGETAQRLEHFGLGPNLGQCCGGSTSVLFECFASAALPIAVFGAGHVGNALVPILAQLPARIHWIDSREGFCEGQVPHNVTRLYSDAPAEAVANLPAQCCYVILTHNHQQDYSILEAVLRRGDARYVGLIGSQTKWRRFQLRLEHRGLQPDDYADVHCPIGLSAVPGKLPIEVAVSIAAELIGVRQTGTRSISGPTRRSLKTLLQDASSAPSDHTLSTPGDWTEAPLQ